jgi:uncharacterized protein YehS (DUF1456 family)
VRGLGSVNNIRLIWGDVTLDIDSDDIACLLKETTSRLEKQSADLQNLLRKAVHQKHLESGDVELF